MIIDVHTHIVPEHFPPVGSRAAGQHWPSMAHVEPGTANVMIAGRNFRTVLSRCWDVSRRVAEMAEPNYAGSSKLLSPMPELLCAYRDTLRWARFGEYLTVLIRVVEQAPDRFFARSASPGRRTGDRRARVCQQLGTARH